MSSLSLAAAQIRAKARFRHLRFLVNSESYTKNGLEPKDGSEFGLVLYSYAIVKKCSLVFQALAYYVCQGRVL